MSCTGHSHDHDHEDQDEEGFSLHESIDKNHVWCLNEEVRDSGKKVLKSYEDRFTATPSLRCQEVFDDDEEPELLLHVPFSEAVSLKSICVRGGSRATGEDNHTADPKNVKLFVDRDDLDFETARELKPIQTIELVPPEHEDGESTIDYPLRPTGKFQNISSITLYIYGNFSGEECLQTEISYVGFKGKGLNFKRRAVETVYESQGMMKDHKVPGDKYGATSRNVF